MEVTATIAEQARIWHYEHRQPPLAKFDAPPFLRRFLCKYLHLVLLLLPANAAATTISLTGTRIQDANSVLSSEDNDGFHALVFESCETLQKARQRRRQELIAQQSRSKGPAACIRTSRLAGIQAYSPLHAHNQQRSSQRKRPG